MVLSTSPLPCDINRVSCFLYSEALASAALWTVERLPAPGLADSQRWTAPQGTHFSNTHQPIKSPYPSHLLYQALTLQATVHLSHTGQGQGQVKTFRTALGPLTPLKPLRPAHLKAAYPALPIPSRWNHKKGSCPQSSLSLCSLIEPGASLWSPPPERHTSSSWEL